MRIFAVLPDPTLNTLQSALVHSFPQGASLESSTSLTDAIQKMFLFGPPDLLVADLSKERAHFAGTLRSLRGQPGFSEMKIVLVKPAQATSEPIEAVSDRILPPAPGPRAFMDIFASVFPGQTAAVPEDLRDPAPSTPLPGEARRTVRKEISTPCAIITGTGKFGGKLRDISLGGARVRTDAELPLSAPVTLAVAVPGQIPPKIVRFKAIVVRKDKMGFGLAFREMDQDTRHFVKHYTGGKLIDFSS